MDIKDPLHIDMNTILQAHNLEQQAKGVEAFARSCLGDDILNHKNLALNYASLIYKQAEALKEQGE